MPIIMTNKCLFLQSFCFISDILTSYPFLIQDGGKPPAFFFKAKKINTLIEHGTFRYYSTFRTEDFRHDHWKEELSEKTLMDFQTLPKCIEAMKLLNYSLFDN